MKHAFLCENNPPWIENMVSTKKWRNQTLKLRIFKQLFYRKRRLTQPEKRRAKRPQRGANNLNIKTITKRPPTSVDAGGLVFSLKTNPKNAVWKKDRFGN